MYELSAYSTPRCTLQPETDGSVGTSRNILHNPLHDTLSLVVSLLRLVVALFQLRHRLGIELVSLQQLRPVNRPLDPPVSALLCLAPANPPLFRNKAHSSLCGESLIHSAGIDESAQSAFFTSSKCQFVHSHRAPPRLGTSLSKLGPPTLIAFGSFSESPIFAASWLPTSMNLFTSFVIFNLFFCVHQVFSTRFKDGKQFESTQEVLACTLQR